MELELTNLRGVTVYATLWNEYADQLSDYILNQTKLGRIIILFNFGKIKLYRGHPYVTNAYNVTQLFINRDDIQEIVDFKNNLLGIKSYEVLSQNISIASTISYSIQDDFLRDTQFKYLKDIPGTTEVKALIVTGEIIGIGPRREWFYNACKKCNHKVEANFAIHENPDGTATQTPIWECSFRTCINDQVVNAVPRFRIPLRVQDTEGTASLTLFERDAVKLLKTTAHQLVEKYKKYGDVKKVPQEFDALIGKWFAFKIDISKFNLDNNFPVYSIQRLTNDVEIMSALSNKNKGEKPAQSDSLDPTFSNFESEDNKQLKDAISVTDENVTPTTVEKSTASSPPANEKGINKVFSTQSELKRNLNVVYDLEDNDDMSTTKKQNTAVGPVKEHQLLIPKLEK